MLCDNCKNKHICKHHEYIKGITVFMTIQITDCEFFSNNQQPVTINPDKRPMKPLYRQPLPSTPNEEEEEIVEDEEKVYINSDSYDNSPKVTSIVDMFMKGDNNND